MSRCKQGFTDWRRDNPIEGGLEAVYEAYERDLGIYRPFIYNNLYVDPSNLIDEPPKTLEFPPLLEDL